jgi:hypothetical protein
MKPTKKLIETPELLRDVMEISDTETLVQLLCVSQTFFMTAASVIWLEVTGVNNLLVLIPGVKCKPCEEDANLRKIVRYSACKPTIACLILCSVVEDHPGWTSQFRTL